MTCALRGVHNCADPALDFWRSNEDDDGIFRAPVAEVRAERDRAVRFYCEKIESTTRACEQWIARAERAEAESARLRRSLDELRAAIAKAVQP